MGGRVTVRARVSVRVRARVRVRTGSLSVHQRQQCGARRGAR